MSDQKKQKKRTDTGKFESTEAKSTAIDPPPKDDPAGKGGVWDPLMQAWRYPEGTYRTPMGEPTQDDDPRLDVPADGPAAMYADPNNVNEIPPARPTDDLTGDVDKPRTFAEQHDVEKWLDALPPLGGDKRGRTVGVDMAASGSRDQSVAVLAKADPLGAPGVKIESVSIIEAKHAVDSNTVFYTDAKGRHRRYSAIREACAEAAHNLNRRYCEIEGDTSQVAWDRAPDWQKASARNGVDGVLLRGNGPRASHASWLAEKEATGWKYGPKKDAIAKEHPCFVPYDELPDAQRAKDDLFVTIVRTVAGLLGYPAPAVAKDDSRATL